MADAPAHLPPPSADQAFCDVSALEGGNIDLPADMFVTTAAKGERHVIPTLSFLINHRPSGTRLLFDLGMRRDARILEKYGSFLAVDSGDDVPTSLAKGGLGPNDIQYVILSHCHWDHVGNTKLFSKSKFVVGSECQALFKPGYPEDPSSAFDSDTLPEGRTEYLDVQSDAWKPIGPFPRALDFFKDGSLYLVDAPGHIPGHLNALIRTSPDGGWLYLAGDSAHDWRLLRGQGEIAMFPGADGVLTCIHQDKAGAEQMMKRVMEVMAIPRVRVLLAHDDEWYDKEESKKAFFPGTIPSL